MLFWKRKSGKEAIVTYRNAISDERARQIDHTLQRVRQVAMLAELEERGAGKVAAGFDLACRHTVATLLMQNGADATAYHMNLVGLAWNALFHAVKSGNRAGADAAAETVAAAAVRLVGAWQHGQAGDNNGGRAA